MRYINIEALDSLFFRDGKPFTMGQDTSVESLTFPPLPSVIYGALRSVYISNHINVNNLESLIIDSEKLQIQNIGICIENEFETDLLFPLPKDLVIPKEMEEEDNEDNYTDYLIKDNNSSISNYEGLEYLIYKGNSMLKSGNFYLRKSDLEYYLAGNTTNIQAENIDNHLIKETKIGIGREKSTSITKDGLLYKINMIRPASKNVRISITVDIGNSLDLGKEKVIGKLGGEGRIMSLREGENTDFNFLNKTTNKFKIYLATPAVFNAGWKPQKFLDKFNLEIISASIDKPIHVGGWDIAKRKPKPMYKAVPAGAIYNLRNISNKENKIQAAIEYIKEYKSISELGTAQQGFGITFIGK